MAYNISEITFEGLRRHCRALKDSEVAVGGSGAIVKVLAEIYACSESKIRYTIKYFRELYADCSEIHFSYSAARNKVISIPKRNLKQKSIEAAALDFYKKKKEMLSYYDEIFHAADWRNKKEILQYRKDLSRIRFCAEECKKHLLESHEFYLAFKLWSFAKKLHPKLPKFLLNFTQDLKESMEAHFDDDLIVKNLNNNKKILSKKTFTNEEICIVMTRLEEAQEYFLTNSL